MTLDDLTKIYRDEIALPRYPGWDEKHRAGVKAVVLALRDEVLRSPSLEDEGMVTVVDDIFDQILGDAGPQDDGILIGNQNVEAIINDLHDEQTSNAADPPQCEWSGSKDGQLSYMGCTGKLEWTYDRHKCPSCGKPIKFKEPT